MNYYKQAIKFMTGKGETSPILWDIAANNPKAICDYQKRVGNPIDEMILAAPTLIDAIKAHRHETGSMLKDSLEYCKALRGDK